MSVVTPGTAPLAKSLSLVTDSAATNPPLLRVPRARKRWKLTITTSGTWRTALNYEIDDELPHLTILRDDHDLVSEGDRMQEDLAYSPAIELVPDAPTKKARKHSNKGRSGENTTARKETAAHTLAFSRPGPLP